MSLSAEQVQINFKKALELGEKIADYNKGIGQAGKGAILFLVLGIFFTPCLVIAFILFLMYYFGKKKLVEPLEREVMELAQDPEVQALLVKYVEEHPDA